MKNIKAVATAVYMGIAAVGLAVSSAHAIVTEEDLYTSGDQLITLDTDGGFEWLDMGETLGRTFYDVSSEFGLGGDFEGWRYATGPEVIKFWMHIGILDVDTAYSEANYGPVLDLMELVDCCGSGQTFIYAMTGDIASSTEVYALWVQYNVGAFDPPRARARTGAVTLKSSRAPSWLVRDAASIPEPATLAIFAIGLAGMGAMRKKRLW